MLLPKSIGKLTTLAIVVGSTYILGTSAFAQSFMFPSASFFAPFASPYESEDEIDIATVLRNTTEYQTLSAKLQEAGLFRTLEQGELLTVLAPTDEAFAALSPQVQQQISKPENLKHLLKYHLVTGIIGEEDIKRRAVATLLERSSVEITGVKVGNKIGVKLNEASANEPITASNGVIIPIDRVLIPPGL